jgi:hypothetical protein
MVHSTDLATSMVAKLKQSFGLSDQQLHEIATMREAEVQQAYAAQLRHVATTNLTRVIDAEAFAAVAAANTDGLRALWQGCDATLKAFVQRQSKDQQWGTYLEAIALAKVLNVHLVVTTRNSTSGEEKMFCLHRTADDNAPVIHLYNNDNVHWYFDPKVNTRGDGNCLYNAFAQALQSQLRAELRPTSTTTAVTDSQLLGLYGVCSTTAEQRAVALQKQEHAQRVQAAIAKALTPREQQMLDAQWTDKFANQWPDSVRQQIMQDFKLALQAAMDNSCLSVDQAASCSIQARHAFTADQTTHARPVLGM